jgi:hypothetical protein
MTRRRLGTEDRRYRLRSEICAGTVEKRPSLSATWLNKRGAFKGRSVVFCDLGLRIPGLTELHSDGYHYLTTRTSTGASQTIGISFRQPGLGGLEALFHCPRCNRRSTRLFDCGGAHLTCRKCAELWYSCQRYSGPGRKALLAQKIRLKLGAAATLTTKFPEKPSRMRRATYRHYKALGEYYEDGLSLRLKHRQPDYTALTPR